MVWLELFPDIPLTSKHLKHLFSFLVLASNMKVCPFFPLYTETLSSSNRFICDLFLFGYGEALTFETWSNFYGYGSSISWINSCKQVCKWNIDQYHHHVLINSLIFCSKLMGEILQSKELHYPIWRETFICGTCLEEIRSFSCLNSSWQRKLM